MNYTVQNEITVFWCVHMLIQTLLFYSHVAASLALYMDTHTHTHRVFAFTCCQTKFFATLGCDMESCDRAKRKQQSHFAVAGFLWLLFCQVFFKQMLVSLQDFFFFFFKLRHSALHGLPIVRFFLCWLLWQVRRIKVLVLITILPLHVNRQLSLRKGY